MDGAKAVENLFNTTGNANQYRPQLMFFVLPNKNAEMYNRIKKSADCRYGIVSQCVQVAHLMKNQAQYHSNVCMKVNAKLGGTTCRVAMVRLVLVYSSLPEVLIIFDSGAMPALSLFQQ